MGSKLPAFEKRRRLFSGVDDESIRCNVSAPCVFRACELWTKDAIRSEDGNAQPSRVHAEGARLGIAPRVRVRERYLQQCSLCRCRFERKETDALGERSGSDEDFG